jgi:hypothetical protein
MLASGDIEYLDQHQPNEVSRTVFAIQDEVVVYSESSMTSPANMFYATLTPEGQMVNPVPLSNISAPTEVKDLQYKCLDLTAPGGKAGSKEQINDIKSKYNYLIYEQASLTPSTWDRKQTERRYLSLFGLMAGPTQCLPTIIWTSQLSFHYWVIDVCL